MSTVDSSALAGSKFGKRRRRGGSIDFELNLAPVIDCLTVLIAFVLVSAAYLSVGIIETGVAAAGQEEAGAVNEPIRVQVELKADHEILVNISGKLNKVKRIRSLGGQWNYNALTDEMAVLKGEWPALKTATLVADNQVDYREVVKSMEIARKAVPNIYLGGF